MRVSGKACPACGSALEEASIRFCGACGAALVTETVRPVGVVPILRVASPAAADPSPDPVRVPETTRPPHGWVPMDPASSSDPALAQGASMALPVSPAPLRTGFTVPPAARRRFGLRLVQVAMAAALAGTAISWLVASSGWFTSPMRSPVTAHVIDSPQGEMLALTVFGAQPGTAVRFGGLEQPLEGGTASFPLSPEALKVGENTVHYELIVPGESAPVPGALALSVPFRVLADLSPLQLESPAIDVIVTAIPGSTVTLDGEPLALDARGRGVRRHPIEVGAVGQGSTGGVVDVRTRYRVEQAESEPAVGELRTQVPVTMLQVQQPGLELVTDATEVELSGRVSPGARVTVNGQLAQVDGERFVYWLELPALQVYEPAVVARTPGSATTTQVVSIRRVANLADEARAFAVDGSLTYAQLAQDPMAYRGRNAVFEGQIYNIEVNAGRSVLQILVRDCPKATACPLWVEYGAVTDRELQQWVRVQGTLAGEQAFRSASDREARVPKLGATYVLPLPR